MPDLWTVMKVVGAVAVLIGCVTGSIALLDRASQGKRNRRENAKKVTAYWRFKEGDDTTVILYADNGGLTPIDDCIVGIGPAKVWATRAGEEIPFNFHNVPAGKVETMPVTADHIDFRDDTPEQMENYEPPYVTLAFTDADNYQWVRGRDKQLRNLGKKKAEP